MLSAISLQVLGCIGLGLLAGMSGLRVVSPAIREHLRAQLSQRPLDGLAAMWMLGLLCHHLALLLVRHLAITLLLTVAGCGIAAAACLLTIYRRGLRGSDGRLGIRLVDTAALASLIAIPILVEPLVAWDARSIWFFHARIIYFAQGLVRDAGWLSPDLGFAHPDYPNLVAGLAAQIAYAAGLWNEHGPKGALVLLLGPVCLFLVERLRVKASFVLLAVLLLALPGALMWDGYMDGWLTAYAVIATLSLVDAIRQRSPLDWTIASASLGLLPLLKNEGILLAGVIMLVGLVLMMGSRRERVPWTAAVSLLLALSPWLAWWMVKTAWGLRVDLSSGPVLQRLVQRAADGAAWTLIARGFRDLGVHWPLLGLAVLLLVAMRRRDGGIRHAVWMTLLAGLAYLFALVAVLLSTPSDLSWHLSVTVSRITLPAAGLFGVTCYLLLRAYEDEAPRVREDDGHTRRQSAPA